MKQVQNQTSMKKVGILTFHSVHNFGAVVQAWAITQALLSIGASPEVIDYRPPGHSAKSKRLGIRRFLPSLGRIKFRRFVRKYISTSPSRHETRESVDAYLRSSDFDALITGSDQVWYKNDHLGFDPVYFLDVGDPQETPRVSYAASCGPNDSLGEDHDRAGEILQTYKAVSVRDARTLAFAKSLGVQNPIRVLDPTLIADLSPLVGTRPVDQRYILLTGRLSRGAHTLVLDLARREELKVVEIGRACEGADEHRPFVDPGQWVNLIAHADLVVSSLFHGCAVSIALRRPFIAFDTAERGFKLVDLLGNLDMENRLVTSEDLAARRPLTHLANLDYTALESQLERERDSSREFLQRAINA